MKIINAHRITTTHNGQTVTATVKSPNDMELACKDFPKNTPLRELIRWATTQIENSVKPTIL